MSNRSKLRLEDDRRVAYHPLRYGMRHVWEERDDEVLPRFPLLEGRTGVTGVPTSRLYVFWKHIQARPSGNDGV